MRKLLQFFRKHKFDLKNPEVVETSCYSYNKYTCQKCGKVYALDRWQMKELPWSMSRGCPGKPSIGPKIMITRVPNRGTNNGYSA